MDKSTKVKKGWYLEYLDIDSEGMVITKRIFLKPLSVGPFNESQGINKFLHKQGIDEWKKVSLDVNERWKKYGEKAKNLDGDRPLPRPCIVCRFPV